MKELILVGASVRAAAFSAIRTGYAPYAIDLYADRDLGAICPAVKVASYSCGLLDALQAAPNTAWIYTGGLENHPRLVDRMAVIRPLLGNRGDVLRQVRDPLKLAAATREAGLAFPAVKRGVVGPEIWLVKPRRGSGGLGVRLATAMELNRPPRGSYLQERIAGEAASAVFVAAGGGAVLLGTTRQLLGRDFGLERPFLYAGSIGPLVLRGDEAAKLNTLGNELAERFKLAGLFNVDLVRTENELWVIEVNPRYSASIEVLERVTERNFVSLHVEVCEGSAILPSAASVSSNGFVGKAIVYARADANVPVALDQLVEKWNQPGQPVGIADLPRVGDAIGAGQPVVTVFAQGETLGDVEIVLRERLETIQEVLSI